MGRERSGGRRLPHGTPRRASSISASPTNVGLPEARWAPRSPRPARRLAPSVRFGAGEGVPAIGAARGSVAAGSVAAGAPETGSAAAGSVDAGSPAPCPVASGSSVALAGGSAQNRGTQPVAAPGTEHDRRDSTGSAQNQPTQPLPAPSSKHDRRDPDLPAQRLGIGVQRRQPDVAAPLQLGKIGLRNPHPPRQLDLGEAVRARLRAASPTPAGNALPSVRHRHRSIHPRHSAEVPYIGYASISRSTVSANAPRGSRRIARAMGPQSSRSPRCSRSTTTASGWLSSGVSGEA